jgi:hypothetical protein
MLLLHRLSHPASGALEVLKLAALVTMVADHANKYALDVGELAFGCGAGGMALGRSASPLESGL